MTIITRFAPSPTGMLHVGNIRTAIHNWLFAKANGGRFMLRIDDTDAARSEERFVDAIRADLGWLGLTPDGEERQSARFALYEQAFERLVAQGRVYPCYETAEELDIRRKILLSRGLPPVYERKAADAPAPSGPDTIAPHWRFKLDHGTSIIWHDLVRGEQHFDPHLLSDPVVRRADGSWLYMLPSAIDDLDMGISHVVRGEDHVSNTATQIQMFSALAPFPDKSTRLVRERKGLSLDKDHSYPDEIASPNDPISSGNGLGGTVPAFAHAALLTGNEGKLSKRLGSLGVDHFREIGIEPQALLAKLARLGTSDPVEAFVDAAPLIATFDFARFGRAPARFDEAELAQLNARIIHQLPYQAVAARLPAGMDETAWNAIRPNLETVAQASDWWNVVTGPIDTASVDAEDCAFLEQATQIAATLDWSLDPWHALTDALKTATGRGGRALFHPLRLALTGRDSGPDMRALLPLIGREAALERLGCAMLNRG